MIKRTVLFGTETSSENILAYATDTAFSLKEQNTITDSSTTRGNDDNVCLMQMLKYRSTEGKGKVKGEGQDEEDSSWRVRYTGLLCMSQVYKHLKSEPRHKTLSNLLWLFINEFEKREDDDRVLEALKVGRVRILSY